MYKNLIFILIAVMLLPYNSSAQKAFKPMCLSELTNKSTNVITNISIYGYVVSWGWQGQEPFCIAFREQQGSEFLIEFLPRSQTLEEWNEMFTIRSLEGQQIENENFLHWREDVSIKSCSTSARKILRNDINELELVEVCGRYSVGGKTFSETTHYLLKKVGGNTYSFHFSKRAKVFDAMTYNFDNDEVKQWSKFLNSIELISGV